VARWPAGYDRPLVRGVLAGVLCLLALLATACGQRAEPTGDNVPLYPVTVSDADGQETSLQREPARIRAVDESMVSTLRALGVAPSRIVVAGTVGAATADTDLTVAWATSRGAGGRSAGPTYIGADGSIAQVRRSLLDLGVLVGRPLRGRVLADRLESQVQHTRDRLAGQPTARVFLDAGRFDTVTSPALVDDIIRTAGGRNVAGAATENRQPSPAELQELRPRYYLATTRSGTTLPRLRSVPGTRALPAVRAGRFGIVPNTMLEPGPRIGDGVLLIARILHPDAFR
jgi:ABC-type Fe3+-hydroxamate transport system substrate-binding protein